MDKIEFKVRVEGKRKYGVSSTSILVTKNS